MTKQQGLDSLCDKFMPNREELLMDLTTAIKEELIDNLNKSDSKAFAACDPSRRRIAFDALSNEWSRLVAEVPEEMIQAVISEVRKRFIDELGKAFTDAEIVAICVASLQTPFLLKRSLSRRLDAVLDSIDKPVAPEMAIVKNLIDRAMAVAGRALNT